VCYPRGLPPSIGPNGPGTWLVPLVSLPGALARRITPTHPLQNEQQKTMNTPASKRLSNLAVSVEWRPKIGRYVYILELTEDESVEVSRLSGYGYDCSLADSCHDITWPREGIVAYHFYESDAADVVEAYSIPDSALATCGMESLRRKVGEFVDCVV